MLTNLIYSAQRLELIESAIEWLKGGQCIALITLVNIEGNAPYPVGTQMLVTEGGQFKGQITGGCAEQAIADQAVHQIKLGQNSSQRYGLDSPYFDIQLPCGSGIDVFIDVSSSLDELQSIQRRLDSREPVSVAIEAENFSFTKRYYPNPRVVILGQGPILVSCAKLALETGFDVLCVGQNESTLDLLERESLTAMSLQHQRDFSTMYDEFTGVVSLFHEHDLETSILAQAVASDVFYIGALGSKKTHAARLETLRTKAVNEDSLSRIHGPVGIDILAKTPFQIAISIVSQVIDKYNKSIDKSLQNMISND